MPTKKYSCFCFSLHLKCKKNLVSVLLQTAFYPENTMWFKVNMKCQYQPFLLGLFLFFYFFKVAYVSIGIRQLAKNYISRLNNLSQAPTVFFYIRVGIFFISTYGQCCGAVAGGAEIILVSLSLYLQFLLLSHHFGLDILFFSSHFT